MIQLSKEGFSIQPVEKDGGIEGAHIVLRLRSQPNVTNPEGGDRKKRQTASSANKTGESLTGDEDMFTWYEVCTPYPEKPDYINTCRGAGCLLGTPRTTYSRNLERD